MDESGSSPSRRAARSGGVRGAAPVPCSRSIRSASPPTVDASNSARSGSSTAKASRTRATTCVASNECPPSAKNSSFTPTSSSSSTSAQICASFVSVGVRGATYVLSSGCRTSSGCGSARRSSFPLGITGSASSSTNAAGTM